MGRQDKPHRAVLACFALVGLLGASVPVALASPGTLVPGEVLQALPLPPESRLTSPLDDKPSSVNADSPQTTPEQPPLPELDGRVAGPDLAPYERHRKTGDIVGTPPEDLPPPEGLAMHELYTQPEGLGMAEIVVEPDGLAMAEILPGLGSLGLAETAGASLLPLAGAGTGLAAVASTLANVNALDVDLAPLSP